jgi:hypothetical protein
MGIPSKAKSKLVTERDREERLCQKFESRCVLRQSEKASFTGETREEAEEALNREESWE